MWAQLFDLQTKIEGEMCSLTTQWLKPSPDTPSK
jgi:hypothetical protein